jgi:hypothetical protein
VQPNDLRISCRPPSPRPHKPTFLRALTKRAARAEPGAGRPVGCMRGLGRIDPICEPSDCVAAPRAPSAPRWSEAAGPCFQEGYSIR